MEHIYRLRVFSVFNNPWGLSLGKKYWVTLKLRIVNGTDFRFSVFAIKPVNILLRYLIS